MSYCKTFTVSVLLILLFASGAAYAQSSNRCDIPVTTEVVDATRGGRNGSINLDFGSASTKDIKIFLATSGSAAGYKEQSDGRLSGLKAGIYDILIVDTSRKECSKQLTIEVKSK